jgi:hypothetical protein
MGVEPVVNGCRRVRHRRQHGGLVDDPVVERRRLEEEDERLLAAQRVELRDDAGILRIDFPGGAGTDQLEHISWDDWFQKFDESKLAFLYQQEKASGEDSTFFKLVSR